MKISIIIPIYQFTEELAELSRAMFESLMKTQGIKDMEIIVVDNGSTMDMETLQKNATIYVKNKTNLGYPIAVNQGFKLAMGDIIFISNNDILVSPNAIEIAKEIFEKNPKVGSVHFRMLPYQEDFWYGFDTWIGGKERWCHASFYAIRREAIPEGGYFEGYSKGGYDDYDFFHRMRDINGWKQAYTNKAVFRHRDSSTYLALDKRDGDRWERDLKNREMYKKRFGEYPDQQFLKNFPEQFTISWKPFP